MKKILLFSAAIAIGFSGFAQETLSTTGNSNLKNSIRNTESFEAVKKATQTSIYGKSTGVSDTFYYSTNAKLTQLFNGDSSRYYIADAAFPADSGAYFGTNVYGADAFGEWYYIRPYGGDTVVKIVGAIARWGGTIQPGSTKTINVKLWNVDTVTQTPIPGFVNAYLIETPGTQIYSQSNIPVTSLKIDTALNTTLFTTSQTVSGAFFLGYDLNYSWSNLGGDTLGLYSTRTGYGWDHGLYMVDTSTVNDDTLVFAQTVRRINNVWNDVLSFDANMSIVPVFVFQGAAIWPANVPAVTKMGLSLYGNYPNPAANNTNIKFSLDQATSVNIQVTDMTGRIVAKTNVGKLSAGEHIVPVQTAELASGNYIYMISTSNGAALAAQFTVTK